MKKERIDEIVALGLALAYLFINIISFYWGYIATPTNEWSAWEYNMSVTGFWVFPMLVFVNLALLYVVLFSNSRKGVRG